MLKLWLSWCCLAALALAGEGPYLRHTISRGQTLASVGRLYGISLSQLLAANPEVEPARLRVGQEIQVPAPSGGWPQWTVQPGQTVMSMGYPLESVGQLNPGVDLNRLQVGQVLQVPVAVSTQEIAAGTPPPQKGETPLRDLSPSATQRGETPLRDLSPSAWELVTLADGRKGWAPRQAMLIPSSRPLTAAEVLELASRFEGAPYVWGGASPNGVDCSGFIQEVFRLAGHSLPRLADAQFEQTHPVESPQPGDLVFFTTYLPGPSHVGISLGGQDFLHASSSRGVIKASLEDNYFKSRYLGARRLPAWSEPHARIP